jgi:MYXO-CTERM domain-containing protein
MTIQNLSWVRVAAALASLCAGSLIQSQAAVVVYTDRSAWATASGGGSALIQDNLNSGTFVRSGYTITTGAPAALGAFPASDSDGDVNGTGFLKSFISQNPTQTQVTFTFSSPVRSVGYDLNSQSSNLGVTVDFILNGTTTGSYTLPVSDVTEFRGIVSTTPFTTFRMTTTATTAWHGIDNLAAYSTVPEPVETMAFGALALTAFGLLRRRSSR